MSAEFGTALLIPYGITDTLFSRTPKHSTTSRFILSVWTKMWFESLYLAPQREAIQERIFGVPAAGVHVVGGEHEALAEQPGYNISTVRSKASILLCQRMWSTVGSAVAAYLIRRP